MKEQELKYVSVNAQCTYLRKQLPMLEADGRANEQLIAHLLKIINSQQRKISSLQVLLLLNSIQEIHLWLCVSYRPGFFASATLL